MKTLLTFMLCWIGAVVVAPANELTLGWQALADYRAADAVLIFAQHEQTDAAAIAREAQFGHGVALLARQPVDASQIEAARRLFQALASHGNDDWAQGAEFHLARIAQHHQPTPDPAEAARHYERLLHAWPNSVWAQTALSRYALLKIYALDADVPPTRRIAAVEDLLAMARLPAAQSDLHQVVADAIFFYRLPAAQALPHLLALAKLDRLDAVIRPDVLVQIAELSRLEGDLAQARTYFQKLLDEYPRDQRRTMVEQRLQTLTPAGVAQASPSTVVEP